MLIPSESPTGFHACYWTQADFLANKPPRHRPIVGWDKFDNALTIDKYGKRVVAAELPGFHSVTQIPRLVTALPGNGWRVAWCILPGEAPTIAPVISWHVYSDGRVRPIANILGAAYMQPIDLGEGDTRLIPPAKDGGGVCLRCGERCDDPFSPDFLNVFGCGITEDAPSA